MAFAFFKSKKEEKVDTNEHKIDTNESVVKSAAKYLNDIKAPEIDNVKLLKNKT